MAVVGGDPTPDRRPAAGASADMTLSVIAVVGLNRRAPEARRLPNDRLLAPECRLTRARTHRVGHGKPLNCHDWPRFPSMLDRATVFGGWEESSGKSRMIRSEPNQSVVAPS